MYHVHLDSVIREHEKADSVPGPIGAELDHSRRRQSHRFLLQTFLVEETLRGEFRRGALETHGDNKLGVGGE